MLDPITFKALLFDMTPEEYEQWEEELKNQPPLTAEEKRITLRFGLLLIAAACNIATMNLVHGLLAYLGCAIYELLIAFLLWFITDGGAHERIPWLVKAIGIPEQQKDDDISS